MIPRVLQHFSCFTLATSIHEHLSETVIYLSFYDIIMPSSSPCALKSLISDLNMRASMDNPCFGLPKETSLLLKILVYSSIISLPTDSGSLFSCWWRFFFLSRTRDFCVIEFLHVGLSHFYRNPSLPLSACISFIRRDLYSWREDLCVYYIL